MNVSLAVRLFMVRFEISPNNFQCLLQSANIALTYILGLDQTCICYETSETISSVAPSQKPPKDLPLSIGVSVQFAETRRS